MRKDQSALELNDRIPDADRPNLFNGQPALRTARQANQERQSLESNLSIADKAKQNYAAILSASSIGWADCMYR